MAQLPQNNKKEKQVNDPDISWAFYQQMKAMQILRKIAARLINIINDITEIDQRKLEHIIECQIKQIQDDLNNKELTLKCNDLFGDDNNFINLTIADIYNIYHNNQVEIGQRRYVLTEFIHLTIKLLKPKFDIIAEYNESYNNTLEITCDQEIIDKETYKNVEYYNCPYCRKKLKKLVF